MVDVMEKDEKVKQVIEALKRQYQTEKYGRLHRRLMKEGIETDLYIGIGIEMHYPDVYNAQFTLHVFDEDNLVVVDQRESFDDSFLKRTLKIAESLGYRVKRFNELTKDEREYFG